MSKNKYIIFQCWITSIFSINEKFEIQVIKLTQNLNFSLYFYGFGYVTLNNRYIITLGTDNTSDIHIFDLHSHTWYKSNLELRKRATRLAALTVNDKLYVIGGYFNKKLDTYSTISISEMLSYDKIKVKGNEIMC